MSSNGLKLAKDTLKLLTTGGNFDYVLEKVKIISGGNGRCSAELVVEQDHQNHMGTLHGGLTATLIDSLSTIALISNKDAAPGVTVNLNISYLKAAAKGETVVIDCNTLRTGRTMAFLEVEIKKKSTGDLLAKGLHTKYVGK